MKTTTLIWRNQTLTAWNMTQRLQRTKWMKNLSRSSLMLLIWTAFKRRNGTTLTSGTVGKFKWMLLRSTTDQAV
ncbi:hypothetical protein F444_02793 [Phytophthora nicotianae P1976]|uniref:Uncharacterized protein n=1 Tax=Phytophthora nicotianae P1976 TaxID=1317066 RepID=A0A081AW70_PHYNI|nr:hypothetical protein F444_02793 [Phytophthora nicotianae P1976]